MRRRVYLIGVLLLSLAAAGAARAQLGGGLGGGYTMSYLDQFGTQQGRLVVKEYFAGGSVSLPENRQLAVDSVVLSATDPQGTHKMFGLRLQVRLPKQADGPVKHHAASSANLDFDEADLLLTTLSRIEELARRPESANPHLTPEVRFSSRGGIHVGYGTGGAVPPALLVHVTSVGGPTTPAQLPVAQIGEFKGLVEKSIARLKAMGAKLPDGMGEARRF
jgi:hypothetical protein